MRNTRIASAGSVLLLAFFWVAPVLLDAQQGTNSPTPTFRTSSRLVLLDVVVTDKSGDPVTGLGVENFSVKEDGKIQNIAFLTPPDRTSSTAGPGLAPGVYSNEAAYRLAGTSPTAIVLDAANTPYKDQLYARRQMLQFLKDQYKPDQKIAIFTLTDKLTVLQDFTGDTKAISEALERLNVSEPPFSRIDSHSQPDLNALRASSQQYQAVTKAFQNFEVTEIQYVADRRADVTLDALRRVTRIFGGLPGRKNIIWLTGGFPFTFITSMSPTAFPSLSTDFGNQRISDQSLPSSHTLESLHMERYEESIRAIAAEMASAQIAIYPVDVRGLIVSRPSDIGTSQETMREIARETGGKAFVNRNDVQNGVALALRDRSATYLMGYYPTNKSRNHDFHSIDLKVNRPGLEMTYRHGYFVVDPNQNKKSNKPDREVVAAWQDNAPYTLVGFQAKLTSISERKARVDFLIDANSLLTEEEASNTRNFDVGFYVGFYSDEGKMLGVRSTKLAREFPPDVYQQILQEGMRLHLDADVPAGTTELRLAVMDYRTGHIGTLSAPSPK